MGVHQRADEHHKPSTEPPTRACKDSRMNYNKNTHTYLLLAVTGDEFAIIQNIYKKYIYKKTHLKQLLDLCHLKL